MPGRLDFPDAIDALYGALDLPAPLRMEISAHHDMSVGDVGVSLTLSPSGRAIRVRALIDIMSMDLIVRSRQAEAILRTALKLASSNRSAVLTETRADAVSSGADLVFAEASVSLDADRRRIGLDLKAAIEDVVEQTEWQGPHLDAAETVEAIRPLVADESRHLIFRP